MSDMAIHAAGEKLVGMYRYRCGMQVKLPAVVGVSEEYVTCKGCQMVGIAIALARQPVPR